MPSVLVMVATFTAGALLVGPAWSGEMASTFGSAWAMLGMAVAALAIGWVAGLLFVRTVGGIGLGFQIGGVVAAAICLFNGQAVYTVPCLAFAVSGWLLQAVMSNRLRWDERERARISRDLF